MIVIYFVIGWLVVWAVCIAYAYRYRRGKGTGRYRHLKPYKGKGMK